MVSFVCVSLRGARPILDRAKCACPPARDRLGLKTTARLLTGVEGLDSALPKTRSPPLGRAFHLRAAHSDQYGGRCKFYRVARSGPKVPRTRSPPTGDLKRLLLKTDASPSRHRLSDDGRPMPVVVTSARDLGVKPTVR